MSSSRDVNRDIRSRILGCFGASTLLHFFGLACLLFSHKLDMLEPSAGAKESLPSKESIEITTPAVTEQALPTTGPEPVSEALPAKEVVSTSLPTPKIKTQKIKTQGHVKAAPVHKSDVHHLPAKTVASVDKTNSAEKESSEPSDGDVTTALEKARAQENPSSEETVDKSQSAAESENDGPSKDASGEVTGDPSPESNAGPSSDELAAAAAEGAQKVAANDRLNQEGSTGTKVKPQNSASGASANETSPPQPSASLTPAIRNADDLKEVPGNPKPEYPENDRRAGKSGTAVFLATVANDGSISQIKQEKSSGSQSIDQSALNAFKKYRYQAGQQGMIRKAFTFNLSGPTEELPGKLRRE